MGDATVWHDNAKSAAADYKHKPSTGVQPRVSSPAAPASSLPPPAPFPLCRITCELVPAATCARWLGPEDGAPVGWRARLAAAARASLADTATSRYIAANIVFVLYSIGIVCIDVYGYGGLQVNGGPILGAFDASLAGESLFPAWYTK